MGQVATIYSACKALYMGRGYADRQARMMRHKAKMLSLSHALIPSITVSLTHALIANPHIPFITKPVDADDHLSKLPQEILDEIFKHVIPKTVTTFDRRWWGPDCDEEHLAILRVSARIGHAALKFFYANTIFCYSLSYEQRRNFGRGPYYEIHELYQPGTYITMDLVQNFKFNISISVDTYMQPGEIEYYIALGRDTLLQFPEPAMARQTCSFHFAYSGYLEGHKYGQCNLLPTIRRMTGFRTLTIEVWYSWNPPKPHRLPLNAKFGTGDHLQVEDLTYRKDLEKELGPGELVERMDAERGYYEQRLTLHPWKFVGSKSVGTAALVKSVEDMETSGL